MDFNSGPKVPFPGFLDIGQFHSPNSADYFIKFPYKARWVRHFPDLNLENFFIILKKYIDYQKSDRFR